MRLPRFTARVVATALATAGVLAGVGTGTAVASGTTPTGPAPFTFCPLGSTGATGDPIVGCISAVGNGGTFKLGKTVVTLTPGTTLQGGLDANFQFIPAAQGQTLSSPAQQVPGGLLGVAKLAGLLPGITDIKAVVELVGPARFDFGAELDVTLPVRVHLVNALLGPSCAIGSAVNPIMLHVTTGETAPPAGVEPLHGTGGELADPMLGTALVLEAKGQELVGNDFAVPGATGCGVAGLLNRVVDSRSGLPAAAGVSEARLNSNSFLTGIDQLPFVTGYHPGI